MGKQKEMIGGCCVCSDERGWDENPLVYCDGHGCNVAVHQACYGITTVPSGPWFCRKCESQERAARVRCELCPLKEGALKRTDNGGWCHVVCALFIPEAWFGNVQTMEPIILKGVPADRFNKSCYICEEHKRESKATTGACMQCNKAGCKAHFHVTCAQQLGLLCEEAGNYDNVKYCGYCTFHFKKLGKDNTTVKLIPPFKPPPTTETPDSTPDKKFPSLAAKEKRVSERDIAPPDLTIAPQWFKMKGKGPPDTASSLGSPEPKMAELSPSTTGTSSNNPPTITASSKFTTANFVETTITPSPANLFSPASVTSPGPAPSSAGSLEGSAAAGLLAIASTQPQSAGAAQGAAQVSTQGSVDGSEKKDRKSSTNSHSFADLANAPLFAVAATPTMHDSKDVEGKKEGKNPAKDVPPSEGVSPEAVGGALKRSRSQDRGEKKPKAKKPRAEKTPGSGGRKSGGHTAPATTPATANKDLPNNDPYKLIPSPPREEEKPKKQGGGRKRKSSTSVTGSAPISPAHTTPLTSIAKVTGSKSNTPSDFTPNSSGMHSPIGKTPDQTKVSPSSNGTAENLVNGGSGLYLPKNNKGKSSSNNNQQNSNSLPIRMEQLLEQQWEQSAAFIMEQGQHFDIASLLSCLYKLKQENVRLEESIEQLTARRDHLLAVNARLALPLSESSQQHQPGGEERRTSQSGGRGGGGQGHRAANHFVAPEATPLVNGPQHQGETSASRTARSPARASPLTNHVSSAATSHLTTPPSTIAATTNSRMSAGDRGISSALSSVVQAGLGVGITPPSSGAGAILPPGLAGHPSMALSEPQRHLMMQQSMLLSQEPSQAMYQAFQHSVLSGLTANPSLHPPGLPIPPHRPNSRGGVGAMSHSPSRKTPTSSAGDKTKEKT